jgi:Ion channel
MLRFFSRVFQFSFVAITVGFGVYIPFTWGRPASLTTPVSMLLYFYTLWGLALIFTAVAAGRLYGWAPYAGIFKPLGWSPKGISLDRQRWMTGVYGFLAYAYSVYAFGLTYLPISQGDRTAFTCGEMDMHTALYFSVITAATVGYGDIAPKSTTARNVVCAEVAMNLIFGVFIFSLLASRPAPPNHQPD